MESVSYSYFMHETYCLQITGCQLGRKVINAKIYRPSLLCVSLVIFSAFFTLQSLSPHHLKFFRSMFRSIDPIDLYLIFNIDA